MNKLQIFTLAVISFGCNNSGKENTKEQHPENSKPVAGFVVSSNVTPVYALNIGNIYSRNNKYTEFLNTSGLPEKLQVSDSGIERYKYSELTYSYDENGRLVNIRTSYVLQHEDPAMAGDTMNYRLLYTDLADTKPEFPGYPEYHISLYPSFLIKEFTTEQYKSIGNGKINQYDTLGRPVSLICFYDHGLDSEISYEKYTYDSNHRIWTSREVQQVVLKIDNEDLATGKSRSELLKFPYNFDKEKKVFTENRLVKVLYK
jgi:hypothetical protein